MSAAKNGQRLSCQTRNLMLERLFAPFPPGKILYEDDDLLVVDKPSGTSTNKGDASCPDDALGRLRASLAARTGVSPADIYLAAPLPLERDASGALLLLKKRELNAPLSAAIGRGEVSVTFVAIAPGTRPPPRSPSVRPIGRTAAGALLELTPSQPKATAARSLLGDATAAIHAARLSLRHPTTGKPLSVAAALPAWADTPRGKPSASAASLLASLQDAASRRYGLAASGLHTTFRLANDGELPVPGAAVDIYDQWAVLHLSSPEAIAQQAAIVDALLSLGVRGVYGKFRPKQANTLVDTRRDEVAPRSPLSGEEAPDPLIVVEGGDKFVTRLGDGLSTGIFLDMRENRALVRSLSSGKRVLNLFAYACAFTVSAVAGGAASSVSVDISRASLAWGEDNLRANGLHDPTRHRFIVDEALTYLRRCAARGDRFDLVLLDPPSYSTTKRTRFSAEHDYGQLAAACVAILTPTGRLLACTNHRGIGWPKFRRVLRDAASAAGHPQAKLRELPPPTDFPPPDGAEPHLKAALLSLR